MRIKSKIDGGPGDWEFTVGRKVADFVVEIDGNCGFKTRDEAKAARLECLVAYRAALDDEIRRVTGGCK